MSNLSTGIAVGLKKGFVVTKREQTAKPSHRKGKLSQRVKLVREVVREVSGLSPYERRILEFIKMGNARANKRCLKFSKARLGTHRRGKAKRDEIQNIWAAMRRQQH